MTRPEFAAALLAVATSRPRTRISSEIGISPTLPDLLVPFTVSIALRNPTHAILPLDFPTTERYRIDVLRDGALVWTSTHGKPLAIPQRIEVPPGRTPLVFYDVDGLTAGQYAFAPGPYLVRVTMLGSLLTSSSEQTVTFARPLTLAQAQASTHAVTVAGTPAIVRGVPLLIDGGDSLPLSQPLGLHPTGTYLVRGTYDRTAAPPVFTVSRFALAAAPATPVPAATADRPP